jgi:glycosyltransferase involved in cell wall biosynthesis
VSGPAAAGDQNLADTDREWVTVITPTLIDNAVFRTHVVIRLLMTRFNVQLVAFGKPGEMYAPLVNDRLVTPDITYHATGIVNWWRQVRAMAPKIRGRAIVCVKPLLASYGAGLVLGRQLKRPVIVDVDDWEVGFLPSGSLDWELRFYGLQWFTKTNSPLFTRILEGRIPSASAVLVSNTVLQGMFGGYWVPHLRTPVDLPPLAAPRPGEKKIVSFVGKPRVQKGLGTLVRAWRLLARQDAILRLIVPDPADALLTTEVKGVPNVEVRGPCPFPELPRLLGEASVIVVPQDNARGSLGQLPVKMLDAMAVGRPIVTTDVCDASRWLADGAGIVVTPGSPEALAQGIARLLDDPAASRAMAECARQRLARFGSEARLSKTICDVVSGSITGQLPPALAAFADDPAS